jgi:hypothetical protein
MGKTVPSNKSSPCFLKSPMNPYWLIACKEAVRRHDEASLSLSRNLLPYRPLRAPNELRIRGNRDLAQANVVHVLDVLSDHPMRVPSWRIRFAMPAGWKPVPRGKAFLNTTDDWHCLFKPAFATARDYFLGVQPVQKGAAPDVARIGSATICFPCEARGCCGRKSGARAKNQGVSR